MAVETDCIMLNDHYCILKVFRPVSYATVLAVLEVPVYHQGSRYTHSRCARFFTGELLDNADELLPACAALNALLGVQSESEPGYWRPVDVISRVDLYDTGIIRDNSPTHHQKVSSNILLPGARVENHRTRSAQHHGMLRGVKAEDRGQYITAIQLLKMSALPCPPPRFGDAPPSRFVDNENMAIKALHLDCMFAPKYSQWHLSLTLRKDEVDDFVHQVSPSDQN
jgi:hypothetical protein